MRSRSTRCGLLIAFIGFILLLLVKMVMIKNALYACAMYIVSVVGLYGFNASVGGPPNKKSAGFGGSEVTIHRDLRQTISVHSDAQSLKGVGRGHAGATSREPYAELRPLQTETVRSVSGSAGSRGAAQYTYDQGFS